jgi:hypothetical protein
MDGSYECLSQLIGRDVDFRLGECPLNFELAKVRLADLVVDVAIFCPTSNRAGPKVRRL